MAGNRKIHVSKRRIAAFPVPDGPYGLRAGSRIAGWERLSHGLLAPHFVPRLYWPRLAGIGVETRRPTGTSLRLSFVPPEKIGTRER